MASAKILRMVLLSIVSLQLISSGADAWSNGGYSADPANPDLGTHDWIAEAALDIQTRDVGFLRTTYHSEFLLGTEGPDNPKYIGDTTNHHIYYRASGTVQDDVCADRASQIYSSALTYLRSGNNMSAAFEIGVLAHYVSDPGVFGHTMGAYTDWGAEAHHSDYEDTIDAKTRSLPHPSGIMLGDSDAYGATMALAQKTTFGSGSIRSNIWMDDIYNWADPTFEASAIASLSEAVYAVGAVLNHLLAEAFPGTNPPPEPPPQPPQAQVPGRPTGLSAVLEQSHVLLSWSYPLSDGGSALTGYDIYRGIEGGDPLHMIGVSVETHSWTDWSTEKGRTYTYWVAARNSIGASPMSVEATITIPEPPESQSAILVISTISAALASCGGVLLWYRWTKIKKVH